MLQRHRGEQKVREYFSTQQRIAIEPAQLAPTWQEAKIWLKAKELLRQREEPKKSSVSNMSLKPGFLSLGVREQIMCVLSRLRVDRLVLLTGVQLSGKQ